MFSENRKSRLPEKIASRLALPLIAAPMLRVSGPDLVIAACLRGIIGAFPVANARTSDELDQWLLLIRNKLTTASDAAPFCPNLIIRRPQLREDLACLVRHKVEMVIASVGSPATVVAPLHDIGCFVFADVATMHHAEKAIADGVDGLVLLTAGAGGQTGWMNPLAFVRAVRAIFDGPIVMAGGIADGHALWAAEILGCDLAYMGTRFIATHESMAAPEYKRMLVQCGMDDVMLTTAFTGLRTNMLRPSIVAAGLDPDNLPARVSAEDADRKFGHGSQTPGPRRYTDIWSAGHTVSGVKQVTSVAELIDQTRSEYEAARRATATRLHGD